MTPSSEELAPSQAIGIGRPSRSGMVDHRTLLHGFIILNTCPRSVQA